MNRFAVSCVSLWLGFSGVAQAGSVYVQYASPSLPNTVIQDPLFATATQPGIFAEADLVAGSFKGYAFHDGSSAIASVAYSGMEFTLTNGGLAPFVFGGAAFPFFADVTGSFSGTAGLADNGNFGQNLTAFLQVDLPGGSDPFARVVYQYGESFSRGASTGTFFSVTPTELSGATTTILTATPSSLVATLDMPPITLAPGGSAVIRFTLLPVASATGGPGFTSTIDVANSAYLHMFLPADAIITTDTGVPLDWITVPEPSVLALLLLGVGALGIIRARG